MFMIKLDHVRITVKDWQLSRDWYTANFGWKVEFQIPDGGPDKLGVVALQEDAGLTLFLEQTANPATGCGYIFYFQVENVDETYRKLSANSVCFLAEPQKFFWGYGAELTDPDGHTLRLWDQTSMDANESGH
jgi:predicted enzyme related to lactoylglutathione lyase